jgi:ammonium transporter, Amt family
MKFGVESRTMADRLKLLGVTGLMAFTAMAALSAIDPALAQDAATQAAPAAAQAAATPPALTFDKSADVWMMVSSLLVLFMTVPGLALFYGGLVRTKNMASVLTQTFMIQCTVCVAWFVYGYSLAFTSGSGPTAPFIGGFSRLFLRGIAGDAGDYNTLVETFSIGVGFHELVFVCFEMTFAAITTALVIGSFVERVKFGTLLVWSVIWMTFVYCPISHMVWFWPGPSGIAGDPSSASTGGQIWQWGALDFAGGSVVHINAGISGLVGCLLAGRRMGYRQEPMPPHSMTLAMTGAAILWVGWFGFNAGSNLEANQYAGLAMANTFVATAAAGLSWMIVEWIFKGKPSLLGLISGVVAGLVAVTPASGFAGPMGALVLGLVVSPICFFFCTAVKNLLGYDDSLDVFGVHCVGGITGALGTGILVNPALGGAGVVDYTTCGAHQFLSCDNAPYDLVAQMTSQIKDVVTVLLWSGLAMLVMTLILSMIFGWRVSEEKEREGLDISEHGERAYHY